MPATVRCPHCSHVLLSIDLPEALTHAPEAPRPAAPDVPLLLRATEAARLLGVSRSTIYQLIASGQMPVVRIGRGMRVVRAELEARWIGLGGKSASR